MNTFLSLDVFITILAKRLIQHMYALWLTDIRAHILHLGVPYMCCARKDTALHVVAATGIMSSPCCCEHSRQPEVTYCTLCSTAHWPMKADLRNKMLRLVAISAAASCCGFLAKAVLFQKRFYVSWMQHRKRLAQRQQFSSIFHI